MEDIFFVFTSKYDIILYNKNILSIKFQFNYNFFEMMIELLIFINHLIIIIN